jgi:hypothetical protein
LLCSIIHSGCFLDIGFVIDCSGSIRDSNVGDDDNWKYIIDFVAKIVEALDISVDGTHVAALTFGRSYSVKFHNSGFLTFVAARQSLLNFKAYS